MNYGGGFIFVATIGIFLSSVSLVSVCCGHVEYGGGLVFKKKVLSVRAVMINCK